MTDRLLQRLVLEPSPETWREEAQVRFDALGDEARQFRAELGLPVDRPIVMTGHQATFWHPGVLSKYVAADALSEHHGFASAWLVADQDTPEHGPMLAPVRDPRGRLESIGVLLMGCAGTNIATASCPAFEPQDPDLRDRTYALPAVERGMSSIIEALRAHGDEPSAANQIAHSAQDLAAPYMSKAPTIYASELTRTRWAGSIVDRLRDDHRRAVELYNEAANRYPDSGVTTLAVRDDDPGDELPLWILAPDDERQRVHVADLAEANLALAPRAILMSGLIRAAACDLFIVGTGGELYDRVTEQWFGGWLGLSLAPRVTVTADLLLPLHESDVTPRDLERAIWRAHTAHHNPSIVGRMAEHAQKRRLVDAIDEARASGDDPAPHFRALHDLLESFRREHAEELQALRDEVIETRQRLGERAIARDRTWAFPLHEPESLAMLKSSLERAVLGAPSPCGAP